MFLFICHVFIAFFGRISYGDFGKLKKADDDNDMCYERVSYIWRGRECQRLFI